MRLVSNLVCHIFLYISLLGGTLGASETITVMNDPVDHATLSVGGINKEQQLLVELFDANNAKLGKSKHQDIAKMLASAAPHLLAADIVEELRNSGFSAVLLDEFGDSPTGNYLVLEGEFTELNPGSQAVRAWIGFGAGKSKICVKGNIKNHTGESIASFSECKSGLGWGESSQQMNKSTDRIGHNIAKLLISWSDGTLE